MWTTPAGVWAAQRGATVSFGCPGVPGTSCHSAVYSTLLLWPYSKCRVEEDDNLLLGHWWHVYFFYIFWRYSMTFRLFTSLENHIGFLCAYSEVNIQGTILTERNRERKAGLSALKCRSLLQIYESISANAAQKSWLSAPPGKCWSVRCFPAHLHHFSPIAYWAADWEELNVFLPLLSSLTDKLVNCMCGIGPRLSVCMNMAEVEFGGLY